MKKILCLLSLAVITFANLAFAQISLMSIDEMKNPTSVFEGFHPLVGAGIGYTGHDNVLQSEGYNSHLKVLGSYYLTQDPIVIDGGLGLFHSEFTQDDFDKDRSASNFLVDIGVRYRLTEEFSVGPILTTLANVGRRFGADSDSAHFIGAQVLQEIQVPDYRIRVGGRLMMDTNISHDRNLNLAMLDLHIGFGEAEKKSAPVVTNALPPQPYARPLQPIRFETNSARTRKSDTQFLERLARVMKTNPHLIQRIEVVGHADERGSNAYNQELSQARAFEITKLLARNGVGNQVSVDWRGENSPRSQLTGELGWAANRRVELRLYGQDKEAIERVLKNIQ